MSSTVEAKKIKLEREENGPSPPHASAAPGPPEDGVGSVGRNNGPSVPEYITGDDARRIVDLISKEQLADIVTNAMLLHADVLEDVRNHVDKDVAMRKIFVRGLGWDTTTDTLKTVFARFGELDEGIVILDRNTGKNRGYGFVTFKHMDGAMNALKESSKRVDGRMVVCHLASMGSSFTTQNTQDVALRKIYVGNVPLEWPVDHLLNIFQQYGEIEEGPLGLDKQAGRQRGYALFIYKTSEGARLALEDPVKTVDGHQLFCKLAVEGLKQRMGAPPQGQSDMQAIPAGVAGSAPAMQYNALPYNAAQQSVLTTSTTYGQNVNPSVSTPVLIGSTYASSSIAAPQNVLPTGPSYGQNVGLSVSAAMSSLGMSATSFEQPVSNPSALSAIGNPLTVNTIGTSSYGFSQVQDLTSGAVGLPSYGVSSAYGLIATTGTCAPTATSHGGQAGPYSGVGNLVAVFNLGFGTSALQTSNSQGQLQFPPSTYQNQVQQHPLVPHQSQQQLSSYTHLQQASLPSTMQGPQSYYGL